MFEINHVNISVSDMDRSVKFYEQFGFKVFNEFNAEDGSIKMKQLEHKNGGAILEIFCLKNHSPLPETAKNLSTDNLIVGTKHFALGVKNIEEAKEFVIKNKIKDSIEIKMSKLGKPYFFISDPDGILFEFIEN